jgi:hypothetical protein
MRIPAILLVTTALSACGGGGPTTVGGNAAPGGATPTAVHSFVEPTEPKTYSAIGGAQSFAYSTDNRNTRGQYGQLYQGDTSTARNSGITVTYNPRDAIFDLVVKQPNSGVDQTLHFQDPIHRTAFGGAREPQSGTPNIANKGIQYLQAGGAAGTLVFDPAQSDMVPVGNDGGARDVFTYFYQKPGTTTSFVTYAGYLRNSTTVIRESDPTPGSMVSWIRQDNVLERGAFVYGERTAVGAIPKTGSGTFTGDMLATMVFNPLRDTDNLAPTYFQWIFGTATTRVDFVANSFTIGLTGSVFAPQLDVFTNRTALLQQGATFTAAGTGRVDIINAGGFLGQINSASFVNPGAGGQRFDLTIGGSSVDGAFFGPVGQEVGGGFRIVGGVPDERIDILGAFTGKN